MTAITSIKAYDAIKPKLGRWKAAVLEFITTHPLCSRKEIARGLVMETASVSGRVNELIADELIEECGTKCCSVSGNIVAALRVVPIQPKLI